MDERITEEEVALAWELCGGRPLSEGAALLIMKQLDQYRPSVVRLALRQCTEELEHSITLGAVVKRIKAQTQKPQCLRDFDDDKALPPHVPQNHIAALARVAQESMGKEWSSKEIEDKIAEAVTEQEAEWEHLGLGALPESEGE
jgi:hypothetical protein